jgi:hypothetical protein
MLMAANEEAAISGMGDIELAARRYPDQHSTSHKLNQ